MDSKVSVDGDAQDENKVKVAASHHVSEPPTNHVAMQFGNVDGTSMTVRRMSRQETWTNMKLRHTDNYDALRRVETEGADGSAAGTSNTTSKGVRNQDNHGAFGHKAESANEATKRRPSAGIKRRLSSVKKDRQSSFNGTYVINDQSTLLETITNPDRLNGLLACDEQVVSYNPRSWAVVLHPRGRNLPMIAGPLLLLTLWYIFWVCLFTYVDGATRIRETIADLHNLISPLLVPVSFLLVFRLGRAAVRFWEARAAIGKLVEMCRVFISTAAIGCCHLHHRPKKDDAIILKDIAHPKNDDDLHNPPKNNDDTIILQEIARWTCVFPIAVKNFLRPVRRMGWDERARDTKRRFELGQLVSEEEAERILNTSGEKYGPILVLNMLRELSWRAATYSSDDDGNREVPEYMYSPRQMFYQQLNSQLDTLTGAWGACERINGTPLPLVYVVHLRTFLLLYLMLWLLEASAESGWVGLPIVLAASWGLLGIEAAAVECERPFQWHSNHLALGKMCVVATNNVAQTLREVQFEH